MFKSDADWFRRKQAIADLRAQARLMSAAAIRRIAAGFGTRRDGGNPQDRIERYFRGKAPVSALAEDRILFSAVLMASAMPDEDHDAFLAATILLLLERLESESGPDNHFWTWRTLAGHVRVAPPPIRSCIMCGFREAARTGRVSLGALPDADDCLTVPKSAVLAEIDRASPGGSAVLGALADAVREDVPPQLAGRLWIAHHREADLMRNGERRAAMRAFRFLYERPPSLRLPPGEAPPFIPPVE